MECYTHNIVDVGGVVPCAAARGDALAARVGHEQPRVVLVPRAAPPVLEAHRATALELKTNKIYFDVYTFIVLKGGYGIRAQTFKCTIHCTAR